RDLVELFLRVSPLRSWNWIDETGEQVSPQSLPTILAQLMRDVALWPLLVRYEYRNVQRMRGGLKISKRWRGADRVLFLRTDHWFNVKSGGSVAHLKGVIEGLRALDITTDIVSTDYLHGLERDHHFHLCRPHYGRCRNIPNLPELLYNRSLVDFVRSQWDLYS